MSTKGRRRLSDELLSVAEVCDRLGVSERTVRDWIRSGELAAIRFGGQTGWRIAAVDFEAFLAKRRLAGELAREAAQELS